MALMISTIVSKGQLNHTNYEDILLDIFLVMSLSLILSY